MTRRFRAIDYGLARRGMACAFAWLAFGGMRMLLMLPDRVLARLCAWAARRRARGRGDSDVDPLDELAAIFGDPDQSAAVLRALLTRGRVEEYYMLLRGLVVTDVLR